MKSGLELGNEAALNTQNSGGFSKSALKPLGSTPKSSPQKNDELEMKAFNKKKVGLPDQTAIKPCLKFSLPWSW